MCTSTDTTDASADGELGSEEEGCDEKYEHDFSAQHFEDHNRSQSCGESDHETDHDGGFPSGTLEGSPLGLDSIPIIFDFQYDNTSGGCRHDYERKGCRCCGPPDIHQFGLCCDCVAQADTSGQCM